MSRIVWTTSWHPGPAAMPAAGGREVLVTLTEFVTQRPWDVAGVAAAGLRLRETWADTEGAVGLLLWLDPGPLRPRSGSLTVWRSAEALRAFVRREDHRRIVDAYRHRGAMRSASWRSAARDEREIWAAARRIADGREPWPPAGPLPAARAAGPNQRLKDHLDGLIDTALLPAPRRKRVPAQRTRPSPGGTDAAA